MLLSFRQSFPGSGELLEVSKPGETMVAGSAAPVAIRRELRILSQKGKEIRVPGSKLSGSVEISLISAVRFGDESAMARVYDRYSAIVYGVALRVLGDPTAGDILRDVFMQL